MGYYAAGDPGFFDFIGSAAKAVGGAIVSGLGGAATGLGAAGLFTGKAFMSLAPIAAPIVGGVFGGPVGAAIGGGIGSLLSGGGDTAGAQTLSAPTVGQDYADMYTQTGPPGGTAWFGGRFAPVPSMPSMNPRAFSQPLPRAMPTSVGFEDDAGGVDWQYDEEE